MKPWPRTLRGRFLAGYCATFLATVSVLVLVFWWQAGSTLNEDLELRAELVTQDLVGHAWERWNGSSGSGLQLLVDALVGAGDVEFVIVQDVEGHIIAQSGTSPELLREARVEIVANGWNGVGPSNRKASLPSGPELLFVSAPVRVEPHDLADLPHGTVRVGISTERTTKAVARALHSSLAIGAIVSLIGITTLHLVTGWALRPLRRITRAVQLLARGDLRQEVICDTDDEMGELARGFNDMTRSLAESAQALKKREKQLESAAADRERLLGKTEARARRFEVLNELTRELVALTDPRQAPATVHRHLGRLFPYDRFELVRVVDHGYEGLFSWSRDPSDGALDWDEHDLRHWLDRVRETRRPAVCGREITSSGSVPDWILEDDFETAYFVPVTSGAELVGIVCLGFRADGRIRTEDRMVIRAMTDTLAVVLEKAESDEMPEGARLAC